MGSTRIENASLTRLIALHSAITCIYVPTILMILTYFESLYNIGKFSCIYLTIICIIAEIFKCALKFISESVRTDNKIKTKKHTSRFKFINVFKCMITLMFMTFAYYVIAVLFGAPVYNEIEQTFVFALNLSMLTVFPACINLGYEATLELLLGLTTFKGNLFSEMFLRNIRYTLVGAWAGAVVIPLDWERPWQVWPIPCILGAFVGYISAHIITVVLRIPSIAKIITKKSTGKYGL